jgi:hypothetical protein
MKTKSFLYGINAAGADLRPYHAAIVESLTARGELPEELNDLFVARFACINPDGTKRYMIDWA